MGSSMRLISETAVFTGSMEPDPPGYKGSSYVEEMVARGKMVRGSADYNRRKNIITRAMGIGTHVEARLF